MYLYCLCAFFSVLLLLFLYQGMKGVPQPRVALGQLLSLDVSRNFLRGVLDDQLLFQLVGKCACIATRMASFEETFCL